jgi:hypothetical protein
MAFNIASFKANGIPLGGARPTLFDVVLTFPQGIGIPLGAMEKLTFTCRAADLPQSAIGKIEVPYFGRKIKINGDRDYPDWRVRIINDEDFSVRSALEQWHYAINSIVPNVMDPAVALVPGGPGASYKTTAEVRQYRKVGQGGITNADTDVIRTYKLEGIFPTIIGAITVDWEATNRIEEFEVDFAYDWVEPIVGASTRSSEEGVSISMGAPGNSFEA